MEYEAIEAIINPECIYSFMMSGDTKNLDGSKGLEISISGAELLEILRAASADLN